MRNRPGKIPAELYSIQNIPATSGLRCTRQGAFPADFPEGWVHYNLARQKYEEAGGTFFRRRFYKYRNGGNGVACAFRLYDVFLPALNEDVTDPAKRSCYALFKW
jgi:hypothetical protein